VIGVEAGAEEDLEVDVEAAQGAEEEVHRPMIGINGTVVESRALLFVEGGQPIALRVPTLLGHRPITGTTPRAVAVVQREGIPGGTTVLPALQVIGHRLRLPLEEGPRDLAAAAAEGIAPGQDLRRARGGTTGRDRAPLTDLTGGSDRARPRPRRRTARRTPAVHARLFLCHRAGRLRVAVSGIGLARIRGVLRRRRGHMGTTEETRGSDCEEIKRSFLSRIASL